LAVSAQNQLYRIAGKSGRRHHRPDILRGIAAIEIPSGYVLPAAAFFYTVI
jgi:hypothetical protein